MKKIKTHLMLWCLAACFIGCSAQKRFVQTDLYFGLSQSNGNIISNSVWNAFVQKEVSAVFAAGFTIIHSEGKWMDTLYKQLHSEPSRIISSVNKLTPKTSAGIDSLREKYKKLFKQESVLRIDKKVSAGF